MVKMNRIVVTCKTTVCLDMRRRSDGSWDTVVQRRIPTRKPKKYKTASWGRLMRQHKRSLRR